MQSGQVNIIAEAGVNHNGSIDMAKKLIDVAAEAGVDAIKFQTFRADSLVTIDAPKAEYQMNKAEGKLETQYQMLKRLELSQDMHRQLREYCELRKVAFLSTPFDNESLQFLITQMNVPCIKISSGDITNAPFLLDIAMTGKQAILSTGMSTLSEIEMALWVLAYGYTTKDTSSLTLSKCRRAYISDEGQQALNDKVTLLHCTTEYPAPFHEVNLNAMKTLKSSFGLPVGYSDHTAGIAVAIAAVACGASIVEKHFTLDKKLPGPDHQASLEPKELHLLVQSIREVESAMGSSIKIPSLSELSNSEVARKSLVARCEIESGEIFDSKNISVKRPGNGISPMQYWDYLGKISPRKYSINELIDHG
jgi:N-acetylneuraminate synthase